MKGGGFYLLGVQGLGCVAIIAWSAMVSFLLLKLVDLTFGLRVKLEDEILGADLVEHGVNSGELPGDEDEQRLYIQLMMQESTRGQSDGSLDYTKSKETSISRMTSFESYYSDSKIDPEVLYQHINRRKRTHVFGSRVRKVHDTPALMNYLQKLNLRRFSDEFLSQNKRENWGKTRPLRSSSLRDIRTEQTNGPIVSPSHYHVNLENTFLQENNEQPIASVSEMVENKTLSNLGFFHESQDLSKTDSCIENVETDVIDVANQRNSFSTRL